MSNLTQRFITAIVGIGIVLSATIYSEFTFLIMILFINLMSLMEFYKLVKNDNIQPQTYFGLLISIILFLPTLLYSGFGIPLDLFPLLIVLPFFVFIRELYTKAEKPFTNIAYTLLGIFYLSLPLFHSSPSSARLRHFAQSEYNSAAGRSD